LALRVPQRGDTVVLHVHAARWSGQALVLAALAV